MLMCTGTHSRGWIIWSSLRLKVISMILSVNIIAMNLIGLMKRNMVKKNKIELIYHLVEKQIIVRKCDPQNVLITNE